MRLSKFYSTIAVFLFSLGACQNDSNTHNSNDVEAQYKEAKQGATSCFNKKEGCNEAIELFDKVIAIDSKHHLAFYNRGVCKMTISDFKGALVDFSKAIELNPEDADYYYNRGYVKLNLNMTNQACEDFKKSLDKGATDAKAIIEQVCK